MKKILSFLVPSVLFFSTVLVTHSATIASDVASNTPYTTGSSWATGQNGGTGFGDWTLRVNNASGSAGHFLANISGNGDLNGIQTGVNGNAWGTFANGTGFQSANGFRGFTGGSLSIGQTFSIAIENGGIQNGGTMGFTLRNGNANSQASDYNVNARFEFLFLGGNSNYFIIDNAGSFDTGVAYTDGGLTVAFTLTATNTYDLAITPVSSSTTILTGRTLATAAGGAGLDSFAVYNRDTENANVYFNSVSVVPEPSALALLVLGGVGLIARRRR